MPAGSGTIAVKMPKTVVVDYGMGNLFSIERAVRHVGGAAEITKDPSVIANAERVILPGVGAFCKAMESLKAGGLYDAILAFTATGRPLLGICLGMQLLLTQSEEFGQSEGLDCIGGKVLKLRGERDHGHKLKVPQIGWNSVEPPEGANSSMWQNTILHDVAPANFFYFVHSYACYCGDGRDVLAETVYGPDRFCSVVRKGNIYGCQFHPERSGEAGLRIIRNFLFVV